MIIKFLSKNKSDGVLFCRMAEQLYTVASDSETTGEDKSQPSFPDVAIGIDIGTSKCSVAVWDGTKLSS